MGFPSVQFPIPLVVHSSPSLEAIETKRVTIACDGSFYVNGNGVRMAAGGGVTRNGHWVAWRLWLPDDITAPSTLAELLAPMFAIETLVGNSPPKPAGTYELVTIRTDNSAVKRWLPNLLGDQMAVPGGVLGNGITVPVVPVPPRVRVQQRPRADPFIVVADHLARAMRSADPRDTARLKVRLDREVRTAFGLPLRTSDDPNR